MSDFHNTASRCWLVSEFLCGILILSKVNETINLDRSERSVLCLERRLHPPANVFPPIQYIRFSLATSHQIEVSSTTKSRQERGLINTQANKPVKEIPWMRGHKPAAFSEPSALSHQMCHTVVATRGKGDNTIMARG